MSWNVPGKIDLRKQLKHLYSPPKEHPELIEVPRLSYLMIDGSGDPNTSQDYKDAVEALYGMAYTLKFGLKYGHIEDAPAADFTVMPLEGLWWVDNDEMDFSDKDTWVWTAMILMPDIITADLVAKGAERLKEKKDPPALPKLRLEAFEEGPSAQIMHVGPYAEEKPTIDKLHAFIETEGLKRRGKHHEIYMSDPRRAKPESLKTIVRQPVEPA